LFVQAQLLAARKNQLPRFTPAASSEHIGYRAETRCVFTCSDPSPIAACGLAGPAITSARTGDIGGAAAQIRATFVHKLNSKACHLSVR
jgi:hypothetical protein